MSKAIYWRHKGTLGDEEIKPNEKKEKKKIGTKSN